MQAVLPTGVARGSVSRHRDQKNDLTVAKAKHAVRERKSANKAYRRFSGKTATLRVLY